MTSSAYPQTLTRSSLLVSTFSRISSVVSWLMKRKSEWWLYSQVDLTLDGTDVSASLVEEPRGTTFNKEKNTLKDMAA